MSRAAGDFRPRRRRAGEDRSGEGGRHRV